ncbi:MAG: glycosyltransferase [Candidatus Moranbacteria bacterium]|nr:glycosyltransferase [Candidatus Moranbacteria bacterium]
MRKYRIAIDARFYGIKSRGLGRYVLKLIKNLEKIDKNNSYTVYLRKEEFHQYRPKSKNFEKKLADVAWYSLKEQIIMPLIFYKGNYDLVHFPHFNVPIFYNKPYIVTIHDLILLAHPTQKATRLNPVFYKIKEIGYKMVLNNALKKSRKILTVSQFTKKDILRHFRHIKKNKIKVIYEGIGGFGINKNSQKVSEKFSKTEKKIFGLKPYLLYVGAAYPHKNLENLLLGWKKIKSKPEFKNLSLVLVGGCDWFYKELKSFAIYNKIKGVVFLGLVKKDRDLKRIYKNCEIFVFPSFYEGFGFPPLEAMQHEIPVVSSPKASLKEILGRGAYYFNPRSPDDISRKIIKVLKKDYLKKQLVKKSRVQVKKFSWFKMAEKTLGQYKKTLNKKQRSSNEFKFYK